MNRKILFVQFSNPAAYPPLEHSSRILADEGWDVTFMGSGAFGLANDLRLAPHRNIRVKQLPFRKPGAGQKIQFLAFSFWVAAEAIRRRARWIYASDALACPAARMSESLLGCRVIYHEHDSPPPATSAFQRHVLRSRRQLARSAHMCVLPNAERIDCFLRETGTRKPVMCVWNCPERHEVSEGGASPRVGTVVFYHGSLNAERLPFSVLGALAVLPESVSLQFAGYATIGRPNYVAEFLAEASRMGVRGRVTYLGAPSDRATLLRHCRQASVGMSLMPSTSRDVNLRAMVGASNKPFDYLASGLPLLVSELPEWRKVFVESGCGLACNPADAKSIASGLGWFAEHPDLAMKMAESGRKRILSDWNYESQFVPVLAALRQTL